MNDLEFVRNGRGAVHVIAACGDPERGYAPEKPWPAHLKAEMADMGPVWALATSPVLALCGMVIKTAEGFPGEWVETFPDEDLCIRCHHALGDNAYLAFEHAQVDPCA